MFEVKGISEQFCKIKNLTIIQLDRIQLTNQTTNHVESTKILYTSQRGSRIIDCYCQNLFLNRRLVTNLCQVLIDVNYTRD